MSEVNSAEAEFRARLAALNARFTAQLPAMLERIEQALAVCLATQGVPALPQLTALHEALHSVAGSAATFGYVVLGQQARVLEQALRGLMRDPAGWPAIAPEVQRYLRWAARDPLATRYD